MEKDSKSQPLNRLTNAIESLNRKFQYAISESTEKGFFIGIADYVEAILDSEILNPLIKIVVIDEREKIVQERERVGNLVIADVKKIYSDLERLIKVKQIKNEFIDAALLDYQKIDDGRTQSSHHIAQSYYNELRDILYAFQQAGFEKIVEKYAVRDGAGTQIDWKISDSYQEYQEACKELSTQLDISVWGAWEQLWWAYASLHKKDELWKQWADESGGISIKMINASGLFKEMELIMDGKRVDQYHHFLIPDFRRHLYRFHNNLLDVVQQTLDEFNAPPEITGPVKVEIRGNLLFMNDKNIPLRAGSKQLDICRVIFKNKQSMTKTWEAADVLKKVDSIYFDSDGRLKQEYRKVLYSAIEKLQIKILTELGIKDYFDFGITTVRINPKYLE